LADTHGFYCYCYTRKEWPNTHTCHIKIHTQKAKSKPRKRRNKKIKKCKKGRGRKPRKEKAKTESTRGSRGLGGQRNVGNEEGRTSYQ